MEDIHDIKELIEILPFWQNNLILLITLGLILTTIISIIILFYLKKRKSRKNTQLNNEVNLSPYEKAIKDLINSKEIMHPGMDKLLSTNISNVIRHYVEKAFNYSVSKKTTEEFLHNLQEEMTLTSKSLEALAQFLEMCDLAKYAKIEFTSNEQKALYEKAKSFLDLAHQEEPQPITILPSIKK